MSSFPLPSLTPLSPRHPQKVATTFLQGERGPRTVVFVPGKKGLWAESGSNVLPYKEKCGRAQPCLLPLIPFKF